MPDRFLRNFRLEWLEVLARARSVYLVPSHTKYPPRRTTTKGEPHRDRIEQRRRNAAMAEMEWQP